MLSLIFFLAGIAGLIGCFCGATHHAMTTAVCLIFGLVFFMEERDERERKKSTH